MEDKTIPKRGFNGTSYQSTIKLYELPKKDNYFDNGNVFKDNMNSQNVRIIHKMGIQRIKLICANWLHFPPAIQSLYWLGNALRRLKVPKGAIYMCAFFP